MSAFQDLAVKIEGSFILRYRVFDIYARTHRSDDLAITAETYGGTFRVYSTKEFPGLSASTELTKVGVFNSSGDGTLSFLLAFGALGIAP